MLAFFSSADDSDVVSYKRLALSLGVGLLAACLAVCVYLVFFYDPARSPGVALVVSIAGVLSTLFTGPWAVVQILLGVRGSYYAFVTVTGLLLYVAFVYSQIKYMPRRFLVFLAGADVFILVFLLWWARLIAW